MKGKPRHNNPNQLRKSCNKRRKWVDSNGRIYCECYGGTYVRNDGTIGTILENDRPWCNPYSENGCNYNPYMCTKMKIKWFASLPKDKQKRIETGEAGYYSTNITHK